MPRCAQKLRQKMSKQGGRRPYYQVSSVDLVFDPPTNTLLKNLSKQLDSGFGDFIPHVTVAAFPTDMTQVVADAIDDLPRIASIALLGLALIPSYREDRLWIELQVGKTEELLRLREQAFLTANFDIADAKDSYRPHITLGCVDFGTPIGDMLDFVSKLEQLQQIVLPTLVVARNGEYGKVVEIVN